MSAAAADPTAQMYTDRVMDSNDPRHHHPLKVHLRLLRPDHWCRHAPHQHHQHTRTSAGRHGTSVVLNKYDRPTSRPVQVEADLFATFGAPGEHMEYPRPGWTVTDLMEMPTQAADLSKDTAKSTPLPVRLHPLAFSLPPSSCPPLSIPQPPLTLAFVIGVGSMDACGPSQPQSHELTNLDANGSRSLESQSGFLSEVTSVQDSIGAFSVNRRGDRIKRLQAAVLPGVPGKQEKEMRENQVALVRTKFTKALTPGIITAADARNIGSCTETNLMLFLPNVPLMKTCVISPFASATCLRRTAVLSWYHSGANSSYQYIDGRTSTWRLRRRERRLVARAADELSEKAGRQRSAVLCIIFGK
ncbi:hypothetical protein DFH07DRAFT_772470 [Mycena maculata]|uniref:Uncharacterized protein n=1 Tax=Mycena maculata TaxID=230809 RepID=A0AAD7NF74_9AGAR|nr:hypothetical protein DFH07DRAFT_772470 [Mycena maculata]